MAEIESVSCIKFAYLGPFQDGDLPGGVKHVKIFDGGWYGCGGKGGKPRLDGETYTTLEMHSDCNVSG